MFIPEVVLRIIAEYTVQWTIVPWVNELESRLIDFHNKVVYSGKQTWDEHKLKLLLGNPMAVDILRGVSLEWISFDNLCSNPADWALDIIEANRGKINWISFSRNLNPRAIAILLQNFDMIDWSGFSTNSGAIPTLRKYPQKIDPEALMLNESPETPELIRDYSIPIKTMMLAGNSAQWAVDILKTKTIKSWYLGTNSHPWAISILRQRNPYDCSPYMLSENPGTIDIIRDHPELARETIYLNPAIFELEVSNKLMHTLKRVFA